MPVIKSSKKRVRQTAKKTASNSRLKRDIRSASQVFEEKLSGGKKTEVANAQTKLNSLLDRASKKNLFHKNKVARRKSRVAKMAKQAAGKKN
ncbi:30S ribosomal protein S20 [Candidatus Saccharibacteria bacterium]|nr:30S ribosomal protein S20 [Candidatus Saccharibacteria bacterium]